MPPRAWGRRAKQPCQTERKVPKQSLEPRGPRGALRGATGFGCSGDPGEEGTGSRRRRRALRLSSLSLHGIGPQPPCPASPAAGREPGRRCLAALRCGGAGRPAATAAHRCPCPSSVGSRTMQEEAASQQLPRHSPQRELGPGVGTSSLLPAPLGEQKQTPPRTDPSAAAHPGRGPRCRPHSAGEGTDGQDGGGPAVPVPLETFAAGLQGLGVSDVEGASVLLGRFKCGQRTPPKRGRGGR